MKSAKMQNLLDKMADRISAYYAWHGRDPARIIITKRMSDFLRAYYSTPAGFIIEFSGIPVVVKAKAL